MYILFEKVIDVAIIAAPLLRYFHETSREKRTQTDAARLAITHEGLYRSALCESSCCVRQLSSTNLVVTRWSGELHAGLDEACGVWTAVRSGIVHDVQFANALPG